MVAWRGPTLLALAGSGSGDPLDGGSGWYGMGNLGRLVRYLKQASKLIGGGIGADLDRIVNVRGLPGCRVESPAAVTRTAVNSIPGVAASGSGR